MTSNSTVDECRTDEERELLKFWRETDDIGRARIAKGANALLSGELTLTSDQIRAMPPSEMVAILDALPELAA